MFSTLNQLVNALISISPPQSSNLRGFRESIPLLHQRTQSQTITHPFFGVSLITPVAKAGIFTPWLGEMWWIPVTKIWGSDCIAWSTLFRLCGKFSQDMNIVIFILFFGKGTLTAKVFVPFFPQNVQIKISQSQFVCAYLVIPVVDDALCLFLGRNHVSWQTNKLSHSEWTLWK